MERPDSADEQQFLAGEREVERHSAELRKELSLPNLVLTQVLSIMGLAWVGIAGKLGSSHLLFWLAAITFFYVPSAAVVIHLSAEMPLEGGLYQWAKLRFSEMVGFLVACNLWLYALGQFSEMGLIVTNNLAYALGPSGAWLTSSKPAIAVSGAAITVILIVVANLGLALGKWIHGVGGFLLLGLFGAMAFFAIPQWLKGAVAGAPVSLALPAMTLLNLNILGKMGFGAMGGFDLVAVFAGECKGVDVAVPIRRSVWIATPIIAGTFILGTASVLVFVKPGDIDLITPITQVLQRGMQAFGMAGSILATVVGLILVTRVGQTILLFNATSRLPMVAGWDHLLPEWFTRLHPRYRTPTGSILFMGASTLVLTVLASLGVGSQEAYQLLENVGGIAYALTYLVMFLIPVAARGERVSWAMRLTAMSGFAMTLLYVTLSVFPVVAVANRWLFVAKVGGLTVGFNLVAAWYFQRGRRRG